MQYSILSFIPILLLVKGISTLFSNVDETKSSVIIISEIFGQLFTLYFGLFFINRVIKYIPTFSKVKYIGSFKVINVVLPMLFTALSFNTKIRNKADLLFNRLMVLIYGEKYNDDDSTKTALIQEGMENKKKYDITNTSVPNVNTGLTQNIQPLPQVTNSIPPPQQNSLPPPQMTQPISVSQDQQYVSHEDFKQTSGPPDFNSMHMSDANNTMTQQYEEPTAFGGGSSSFGAW
jgi:hypothetical protein